MQDRTQDDSGAGRLRVVTVGAGYFSAFHVAGWLANPDADLVGLCDLDPDRARSLLAHSPDPGHRVAGYADAAEALAAERPDIVDIAAPPQAHLALIRLALDAAPRAIVCQKPFCGGLDDARRAVAAARARGTPLVVHENFRFQPWYRLIRARIAAGAIGAPYQATFRLRPGDGQGPDAYLARQPYFQAMPRFLVHETAIHWIDTFRFLLGEPDSVYADLRRLNPHIAGEDAGFVMFRYRDGRRALFDGNRLADHAAGNTRLTMGECLVEGAEGSLALDGEGRVWHRARGARSPGLLPCAIDREDFGGGCVRALQRHVTDHLRTGTALENEAAAYLRNQEIEEAVYASARDGRIVDLAPTAEAAGPAR